MCRTIPVYQRAHEMRLVLRLTPLLLQTFRGLKLGTRVSSVGACQVVMLQGCLEGLLKPWPLSHQQRLTANPNYAVNRTPYRHSKHVFLNLQPSTQQWTLANGRLLLQQLKTTLGDHRLSSPVHVHVHAALHAHTYTHIHTHIYIYTITYSLHCGSVFG